MRPKLFALAALLPFSLLAATNAVSELDSVIVYSSRLGSSPREIPAAVQVIGTDEIRASGARDVVDLLSMKTPALNVHRLGGGNPALAQLAPAGWGEYGFGRLLVLLDGERLNSPDMNPPDLSRIALGAISQLEIIDGSQCVLHGDNASMGVINIVTDPGDYDAHGRFEAHAGSWDTYGGSVALRGGIADERIRYWSSLAYDRSDGYRDNTGYEIWNLNAGLEQLFDNGSFVKAGAFFGYVDYGMPGYLTREEWHRSPRESVADDDYYRRTAYGGSLELSGVIDEGRSLRLGMNVSRRLMHTRYRREEFDESSSGYVADDRNRYDIWSFEVSPQYCDKTDLLGFDNGFVSGLLYRYDRSHNHNYGSYDSYFSGTVWPYAYGERYALDRHTMGAFAQDTFRLNDEFALQFGGRYQRFWNENTRHDAASIDDTWAADAALLFTPDESLKTYLRFSRFFRAPFLDEMNFAEGENLDPEYGYRADVGGDIFFTDELSVGADLFASRTTDEIFCYWNPLRGTLADNINSPADVIRKGLSARLAWKRDKTAALVFAATWVKAEFDGGEFDGNRVPLVPEVTASVDGRVWITDSFDIFGGYRYESYQFSASDFANDGARGGSRDCRVPAYGIFRAGCGYEPAFAEWTRGWRIVFTVDNLFDRNYCDYAAYGMAYYPGDGRYFSLSLSYEF